MYRRVSLAVLVITIVAFSSGCATLGWKPSEDQLAQYESNLLAANMAEAAVFIVFDQLCVSGTIPEKSCVTGYAADKEWNSAFSLAMSAIADYRAGVGSEEMMRKYVAAATQSVIRIINLIKDAIAQQPKAAAARSKAKALPLAK